MRFINKQHNRLSLPAALAFALIAAMAAISPMTAQAEAQPGDTNGATIHIGAPQAQEGNDPEANLPFLFAVFIITWAAFFGYVFYMSRRQREMRREIRALQRLLDQRDSGRE